MEHKQCNIKIKVFMEYKECNLKNMGFQGIQTV
jgi:hypothetical protein